VSTVVCQSEVLSHGKMAELDVHSLLQSWPNIYYTPCSAANHDEAPLNDGSTGALSEDNGAYVFSRAVATGRDIPAADQFRVGATTAINGQKYSVASNEQVALIAAQGELPRLPPLGQSFAMVELRGQGAAQVLSIDYGPTLAGESPALSLGRPVTLDELQMTGLKDGSAKDEKGRQFNCPNCGATVEVALAQSKSITCKSCNSLIDLSAGIGGELRHAEQDETVRPLIPLGPWASSKAWPGRWWASSTAWARSPATTSSSAGRSTCSTTPGAASVSWWTPPMAGAWSSR
jgi:hypothetical protein